MSKEALNLERKRRAPDVNPHGGSQKTEKMMGIPGYSMFTMVFHRENHGRILVQ